MNNKETKFNVDESKAVQTAKDLDKTSAITFSKFIVDRFKDVCYFLEAKRLIESSNKKLEMDLIINSEEPTNLHKRVEFFKFR